LRKRKVDELKKEKRKSAEEREREREREREKTEWRRGERLRD